MAVWVSCFDVGVHDAAISGVLRDLIYMTLVNVMVVKGI
jgi:hypothetical protein